MAKDIQIDNGEFTRIHNDILDALAKSHLTGQEIRILLFLLRKTYGWNKKEDAISLSQFADGIGLKHSQKVVSVLAELLSKKIIYRNKKVGLIWVYGFNKHLDQWLIATPPQGSSTLQGSTLEGTETTPPQGTGSSTPQGTNKRQLKTIKDNIDVVLFPDSLNTPEFINQWSEWCTYRTQIKKKLSPLTQKKQLQNLEKFGSAKAIEMIDQSISKGWQGLFEVKNTTTELSLGLRN